MKQANRLLLSLIALALLGGCELGSDSLSLTGGDTVTYLCEQNQQVQVRYFSLSDKSLSFIKLRLPDGRNYTLPRAVAASGTRYTDEHEAVWWDKGREGFVETLDQYGKWQTLYNACKQQ